MTVSITVERYWAVCKPTVKIDPILKDSTDRMNESINISLMQEYRNAGLVQNKNIRVAKYLIPVIAASVLLNVPKFIETSVAYDEETGEVNK